MNDTAGVFVFLGQRPLPDRWPTHSDGDRCGAAITFGGKLTENIVQGICRDLIAGAMLALEPRGYPVIASVHDEVICEVPTAWGSKEEMVEIMCQVPDWAKGFPVAAEAKEGIRYGK